MKSKSVVVTAAEVPGLLRSLKHREADAETAVQRGWLQRQKVEGIWLYETSEGAIDAAADTTYRMISTTLAKWFLGPLHPLSGYVSKYVGDHPSVTKKVVGALVRRFLREDRLGALAVFTNELQPYLVAFRHEDRPEIDRQISFVAKNLETKGRVRPGELPSTESERTYRAWRNSILEHGEYVGMGWLDEGELVAWA